MSDLIDYSEYPKLYTDPAKGRRSTLRDSGYSRRTIGAISNLQAAQAKHNNYVKGMINNAQQANLYITQGDKYAAIANAKESKSIAKAANNTYALAKEQATQLKEKSNAVQGYEEKYHAQRNPTKEEVTQAEEASANVEGVAATVYSKKPVKLDEAKAQEIYTSYLSKEGLMNEGETLEEWRNRMTQSNRAALLDQKENAGPSGKVEYLQEAEYVDTTGNPLVITEEKTRKIPGTAEQISGYAGQVTKFGERDKEHAGSVGGLINDAKSATSPFASVYDDLQKYLHP